MTTRWPLPPLPPLHPPLPLLPLRIAVLPQVRASHPLLNHTDMYNGPMLGVRITNAAVNRLRTTPEGITIECFVSK